MNTFKETDKETAKINDAIVEQVSGGAIPEEKTVTDVEPKDRDIAMGF